VFGGICVGILGCVVVVVIVTYFVAGVSDDIDVVECVVVRSDVDVVVYTL